MRKPSIKVLFLACAAAAVPLASSAARSSAFGIDAFNASVPASSDVNGLFSPFGFEIDCAVFGEAADPITRAGIAESMGVLTDFASVYRPMIDRYADVASTNGFSYISARAFCLPEISMASADYRRRLWELCGAEVCRLVPTGGAEAWFRAKMMGEMEDFYVTPSVSQAERYSYYDLVSIAVAWRGQSDSAERRKFHAADGRDVDMEFFRMRRTIRRRSTSLFTLLKLPVADGAYLYVMIPAKGASLKDVRERLKGDDFTSLRASVDTLGDTDAGPARVSLAFPALDFTAKAGLSVPLLNAKVPQGGFTSLKETLSRRDSEQVVRFRIVDDPEVKADEPEYATADLGEVVVDRPFVFFVHRPDDDTLSVVGQFTGR